MKLHPSARFWILLRFLPIYLVELAKCNIRVASDVLRRRPDFQPGWVRVDVSAYGPMARWAAACLVSMTPGTLVLDVDEKTNTLLVHALYVTDAKSAVAELDTLLTRALGPNHLDKIKGATNP